MFLGDLVWVFQFVFRGRILRQKQYQFHKRFIPLPPGSTGRRIALIVWTHCFWLKTSHTFRDMAEHYSLRVEGMSPHIMILIGLQRNEFKMKYIPSGETALLG